MKSQFPKLSILGALLIALAPLGNAAPPTADDDKAMAGVWLVSAGIGVRQYEINENRNIKIVGAGAGKKTGRLVPQQDGSYVGNVDGGIIRLIRNKDGDTLTVEYYTDKKDIERKLPPQWKGTAPRKNN